MKSKFRFLYLLSRLGKHKHASGPRLLARLLRDERGSYLIYFAVAFPVFIGFAGLSTEGALLFYNHRTLQSAADSAAYSAAVAYSLNTSADITTQAKAVVGSYGYVLGTSADQADVATPTVIPNYAGSGYTAIQVNASRPQSRFFSSVWTSGLQPVGASAIAIIAGPNGGGGQCIVSLSPTGATKPPNAGAGITVQGTSTISAPDCGVFSNSNAPNSIYMSGTSSSIDAGSVGTVGGVTISGGSTTDPPPTSGDGAMTNPYANLTLPAPGTCFPADAGVIKGTTTTLQPGTYCAGGINVTNGANVTLSPGTYILENTTPWSSNDAAQFIVDSQSTITGKGVTLVFTDPNGAKYKTPNDVAMNIASGATADLEAPALTATLGVPGMLILGDTNMPTSSTFSLWANSSSLISGVIYLPNGNFNWGGAPIATGGCTQMVAYTINLQGNATFSNTGCDLPGGGGTGSGGPKPIGSIVTLVR